MDNDRRRAVLALRAVAASAEKLADDLQGNRLWEREFDTAVAEIQRWMRDLPRLP
jgi:hypothetical protein